MHINKYKCSIYIFETTFSIAYLDNQESIHTQSWKNLLKHIPCNV